jgi:hypothetical protein
MLKIPCSSISPYFTAKAPKSLFKFWFCKRKLEAKGSGEVFFEQHTPRYGARKRRRQVLLMPVCSAKDKFKHALRLGKTACISVMISFQILASKISGTC